MIISPFRKEAQLEVFKAPPVLFYFKIALLGDFR